MTTQEKARRALALAIRYGKVTRPDVCSCCDVTTAVQAHHTDYDRPLDVTWLCETCHRRLHLGSRKGQKRGKAPVPHGSINASMLLEAELAFQQAFALTDELREARRQLVLTAVSEGWSYGHISDATGMSRARIGQIAQTAWMGTETPVGNTSRSDTRRAAKRSGSKKNPPF